MAPRYKILSIILLVVVILSSYVVGSDIFKAVEDNDVATVKALIESGVDVNQCDASVKTPLHIAAENGYVEIVKELMGAGADIRKTDNRLYTPLLAAASGCRSYEDQLKIELWKEGKDNRSYQPHSKCGHYEVIKELIEAGAQIAHVGFFVGTTPLREAIYGRNVDIVNILVLNGDEINEKSDTGITPIELAVQHGETEIVKELLKFGADTNLDTDEGKSLIFIAVEKGYRDIIKELIKAKAPFPEALRINAIEKAIFNDIIQETQTLQDVLSEEKDLINKKGELFYPLEMAINLGNVDAIKTLIENGANVNLIIEGGETPFTIAVGSGNIDIVRVMIKAGSNVNQVNDYGFTPLHSASCNGDVEIIKLLLDAGAEVNKRASLGQTPIYQASWLGNNSVEVIEALVQVGADVNIPGIGGAPPLAIALQSNRIPVVQTLIKAGADVNRTDRGGQTPIFEASTQEMISILTTAGADINLADKDGNTPLHNAIYHRFAEELNLVKVLIEFGADVNKENNRGETPDLTALRDYGRKIEFKRKHYSDKEYDQWKEGPEYEVLTQKYYLIINEIIKAREAEKLK